MSKDYYSILGISKDASKDDIKKAYRDLSKKWHPDKHKGEKDVQDKYKEINEAYEVLSNDKKKQMYDQYGSNGPGPSGGGGFGGFDFSGATQGDFGGFSDIFETFFSGAQRQGGGAKRQSRGRDIEIELTIDLATVLVGEEKEVTLQKYIQCKTCSGNGSEPGSSLKTCGECGGTGQVVRVAQSFFGTIQQASVCTKCHGSGKVPEKPCTSCKGSGRRQEKVSMNVSIPPGIHDGQTLRLREEGEAGESGSTPGDLFVHIRVKKDQRFTRDEDDIKTSMTLSVVDVILGTDISVDTLHGKVKLSIPAGTQPGQVLRIKGKGLPVLNSSKMGDHFVQVNVEIPKKLSGKEKKLLEEWKGLR